MSGLKGDADNTVFAFSLTINSDLGRIAPPDDVMPRRVMGATVNHVVVGLRLKPAGFCGVLD